MSFRILCLCTMAAAGLTGIAYAVNPKSIFDDDWAPPKPVATQTDPASQSVATGGPQTTDPNLPPVIAASARIAVPDRKAQAAARRVLRDVFAEQLADTSAPGRRKLAQDLLAQADRSTDAPVDRFVLLAAAMDASVEGGTLPLAFKAADVMGLAFDIDPLAVKAEKFAKLNTKAVTTGQSASAVENNFTAALEVIDQLAAADDYARAAQLLGLLQPLAAGDPKLRAQLQRQMKDLTAARAAHDQISKQIEKLAAFPDDPAANLAVGSYLCFNKGDWKAGLPRLFRGGDPTLKRLAEQDLLNSSAVDALAALADGWWAVAEKQMGVARSHVQAHAADLYRKALPSLKGLARAQADKRIATMESASGSSFVAGSGPVRQGSFTATDNKAKPLVTRPKDKTYADLVAAATARTGSPDPRKAALESLAHDYPGDTDVAAIMFDKAGEMAAHYNERKIALSYLDSYLPNSPRVITLMKIRALEESPVHYDERKIALAYLARINDDPEVITVMKTKTEQRTAHADERKIAINYLIARGPQEKGVIELMKTVASQHDWAHADERKAAISFLISVAPKDPEVRQIMIAIVADPPNKRHSDEVKMAKAFLAKR